MKGFSEQGHRLVLSPSPRARCRARSLNGCGHLSLPTRPPPPPGQPARLRSPLTGCPLGRWQKMQALGGELAPSPQGRRLSLPWSGSQRRLSHIPLPRLGAAVEHRGQRLACPRPEPGRALHCGDGGHSWGGRCHTADLAPEAGLKGHGLTTVSSSTHGPWPWLAGH